MFNNNIIYYISKSNDNDALILVIQLLIKNKLSCEYSINYVRVTLTIYRLSISQTIDSH